MHYHLHDSLTIFWTSVELPSPCFRPVVVSVPSSWRPGNLLNIFQTLKSYLALLTERTKKTSTTNSDSLVPVHILLQFPISNVLAISRLAFIHLLCSMAVRQPSGHFPCSTDTKLASSTKRPETARGMSRVESPEVFYSPQSDAAAPTRPLMLPLPRHVSQRHSHLPQRRPEPPAGQKVYTWINEDARKKKKKACEERQEIFVFFNSITVSTFLCSWRVQRKAEVLRDCFLLRVGSADKNIRSLWYFPSHKIFFF